MIHDRVIAFVFIIKFLKGIDVMIRAVESVDEPIVVRLDTGLIKSTPHGMNDPWERIGTRSCALADDP